MCRVLQVASSGFYRWLHKPKSDRAMEDERLLELIRDSHTASGGRPPRQPTKGTQRRGKTKKQEKTTTQEKPGYLQYAQPTKPAWMGAELLEHVWNAWLDGVDVAVTSMPFFCYEKE